MKTIEHKNPEGKEIILSTKVYFIGCVSSYYSQSPDQGSLVAEVVRSKNLITQLLIDECTQGHKISHTYSCDANE